MTHYRSADHHFIREDKQDFCDWLVYDQHLDPNTSIHYVRAVRTAERFAGRHGLTYTELYSVSYQEAKATVDELVRSPAYHYEICSWNVYALKALEKYLEYLKPSAEVDWENWSLEEEDPESWEYENDIEDQDISTKTKQELLDELKADLEKYEKYCNYLDGAFEFLENDMEYNYSVKEKDCSLIEDIICDLMDLADDIADKCDEIAEEDVYFNSISTIEEFMNREALKE